MQHNKVSYKNCIKTTFLTFLTSKLSLQLQKRFSLIFDEIFKIKCKTCKVDFWREKSNIFSKNFLGGSLIIWSHYESPFLSDKPFDQKEKVPNESESSVINTQASNSVLSKFPTTAVLLDFGGGAAVEITEFSYSCSFVA